MKGKWLIICSVLMLLGIASCKKDYPEDIPMWLQEQILKEKRNGGGSSRLSVSEFALGDTTLYYFNRSYCTGQEQYMAYYDEAGNHLCTYILGVWNCTFNGWTDPVFVRKIWQDEDKCK